MVGIDICAVVDPRLGVEPASRAELDQTGEMVKNEGVRGGASCWTQRPSRTFATNPKMGYEQTGQAGKLINVTYEPPAY